MKQPEELGDESLEMVRKILETKECPEATVVLCGALYIMLKGMDSPLAEQTKALSFSVLKQYLLIDELTKHTNSPH